MGEIPLGSHGYKPSREETKLQSITEKQGRGKGMDSHNQELVNEELELAYDFQRRVSNSLDQGLSPEISRSGKGVGFNTRVWRSGDAHNIGHFLRLRLDSHAQYEIRKYAELISDAYGRQLPVTREALDDYVIGSMKMSRMMVDHLANKQVIPDNILPNVGPDFMARIEQYHQDPSYEEGKALNTEIIDFFKDSKMLVKKKGVGLTVGREAAEAVNQILKLKGKL